MDASLLVELLTEELPPKSLKELSQAFANNLLLELQRERFLSDRSAARAFATPRRLAVLISGVQDRSPDSERDVHGPAVGAPAQAVAGFARKSGVAIEALRTAQTPKGQVYVAHVISEGRALVDVLAAKVEAALKALPIPKLMRWGDGEAQFVRPVHGLVMMHGSHVVPGTVLGITAGSTTRGHRFMGAASIPLANAEAYEAALRDEGMVIADFAARRAEIEAALAAEARRQGAALGAYSDLLDEVTALVEYPSVYLGEFDARYLEVPQECLILTMRQNQKYFPLFDADGRLRPQFLIVSNMRIADPGNIVRGNQRVIRPRLDDARFFYDQDRKLRLESRVPQLAKVVYHNKLGSQLERVERLQLVAGSIARRLDASPALAERAAWLAKADLLTGMVGEFPELQGVMGRYYALHDGEPQEVADAIEAHYRPRFAGDTLPEGPVACSVALADKLDALVGMFSVGGAPTGEKDPFGLRRQALGALRILLERRLALALPALIADAASRFAPGTVKAPVAAQVFEFMLERLRNHLREHGYAADEIDAVLGQLPERIDLVPARLEAVKAFRVLPEAESLSAANKRIRNILKKADLANDRASEALLSEPAERALYASVRDLAPQVQSCIDALDYAGALRLLAGMRGSVDTFFDDVMVNVEDPKLRGNRLGLLRQLDSLMNRVADISRLAA